MIMKLFDEMMQDPQLNYQPFVDQQNKAYWTLTFHLPRSDHTYELRIRHYWDDKKWNHYSFFRCDYAIGDPVQLVTREEFDGRVQAIRDNEGEEVAENWRMNQLEWRVMNNPEADIKAALIRRWEAVCELISPGVTL